MSRSYHLEVYLEKPANLEKLKKFFCDWCGEDQIYQVKKDKVICEMGCSGGINPEDKISVLLQQLRNKNFRVNREGIIAWSLHPDDAIKLRRVSEWKW